MSLISDTGMRLGEARGIYKTDVMIEDKKKSPRAMMLPGIFLLVSVETNRISTF